MIGGLADLCKHRLSQDGVGEGSVLEQGARQDLSRQIFPSVVAHAEVQDLVRHCIGLHCNYHTSDKLFTPASLQNISIL